MPFLSGQGSITDLQFSLPKAETVNEVYAGCRRLSEGTTLLFIAGLQGPFGEDTRHDSRPTHTL